MNTHRILLAGFASVVLPAAALAQTDLGPLNLPTAPAFLPHTENFEGGAGSLLPWMAVSNFDWNTQVTDAESWCNVGQLAPCISPAQGSFCLEMGLIPGSTNYHDVQNALVLLFDPLGYTGPLTISFQGHNWGEEIDPEDGVWVSNDGTGWYNIFAPWGSPNFDSSGTWAETGAIPLTTGGNPVDFTVPFYVAFVQQDNFPYQDLDGAGVDDIRIPGIAKRPVLSVDPLTSGLYGLIRLESDYPNVSARFLASRFGGGPSTVLGVDLDLTQPILDLGTIATDAEGEAIMPVLVPAGANGLQIWFQTVVLPGTGAAVSTGITTTIQ